MALFNDIRNIINPLPNKYYNDMLMNIDNILENIIMTPGSNSIYNSFVFNHILYTKSNYNLSIKDKVIECIKKHLSSNVRNQRIHFRELNRKNKLNISDFNIYFDGFYKLLNKLNAMFLHIMATDKIHNDKFKWGSSIITTTGVDCLCRFLCEDIIFKSSILKYIKNVALNKTHDSDMFKLNIYMNIFSDYNSNTWYETTFISYLDEALVNTIPLITSLDMDAEQNIIDINNFGIMNKYYNESFKTYYYITKQYVLKQFNTEITNILKKILSTNEIQFVKNFLVNYKKELRNLFKYKCFDIYMILLSFTPSDFQTFISYFLALSEITMIANDTNNEINDIIMICMKDTINNKYGSEQIEELVNMINSNIILEEDDNKLYYILGKCFKNQDEYMLLLCYKLMERCIYSDISFETEMYNYHILNSIYSEKKMLYNYNKILSDKENSNKYSKLDYNFLITSSELWKLNYSIGYTETIINSQEFTTLICNSIGKYNINEMNNSKKLINYLHIGSVDINILNSNVIVLPAHMIILEQFINEDFNIDFKLLFDNVKLSMTNYSDEYIHKLFNSLYISKILIKCNNNISINKDYLLQQNQINVIDIITNITNIKVEIKKQIDITLAHDREDIIKANINHYVKIKNYNIDELYNMLYTNINLFELNRELFTKTLNDMINNNYIIKEADIIKKIVY